MGVECSIIVPTFNTRDITLSCLTAIQSHPPQRSYEIILVDNNSSDGTLEKACRRFPDITVVKNPANLGFGKACNKGAALAQGKYLLFLNSDTEPQDQTFDLLCRWLDEHPRTGIVGPELVSLNHRISQMSWGWNPILFGELIQQFFAPYSVRRSRLKQKWVKWLQRQSREVAIICGACMMVRKETFEQIGGFDEDFELYFEDSDLCIRSLRAGWLVHFLPEARIIHRLGQSTRGSWGLTPLVYRQSQISYYRKHAPRLAIPLLKVYLLLKWSKIFYKSKRPRKDIALVNQYLDRFLSVILEKKHFSLADQ